MTKERGFGFLGPINCRRVNKEYERKYEENILKIRVILVRFICVDSSQY